MGINLTTPISIPDVTHQGVTGIDLQFPHFHDAGEMKLNKPDIKVTFRVTTWAGDGTVIGETRHIAAFPDWPAAFTTDVRAVYSRIEQYAIAQGFMDAGVAEQV